MKNVDEWMQERMELAAERLKTAEHENGAPAPFDSYFCKMAAFANEMLALAVKIREGAHENFTIEEWKSENRKLYEDILPQNYEHSYGNPQYAVAVLGETHGRILSFLYAELRGMIVLAYEQRWEELLILSELLIEVNGCFEREELPEYREIQQILYWYVSDYSDQFVTRRIRENIDPSLDFVTKIIMESDLNDLSYLYRYGEYVSENVLQTAEFLNSLSQKEIDRIAEVYTEGYRIGFVAAGKDLSMKKTVNIRYTLGFERIVKKAIENFAQMGLQPVIFRAAIHSVNKRQHFRMGYTGAVPNKQFDYDHKADAAIYMDKAFVERKLGVMRTAYEHYKELAAGHAGPAVIEIFGEIPFVPEPKSEAYRLSEKQQKLSVDLANEAGQITNRYIKGEERSFTIIAFPVPEIGPKFQEIFAETVKINTLDYMVYRNIQQVLIDALDQGAAVHILGKGENHTDLTVALKKLEQPEKQTLFENCVADVNIPVGEVFTSPKLTGTNGVLHVSEVYLEELKFEQLEITFKDGMITDYICGNFDSEEKNLAYIRENILFHHETLPMGEFAIGTNTTAYRMARTYDIAGRLPILIAEKTGPHFAVGDTCYSWAEDTAVYNPDGKEIIARDNEVSILRKEDPSKAYFGCHTDITIPFDELGRISVLKADGTQIDLIRDGKFVLPGTEALNEPLENEDAD
ncbi:MAG: aminopeptidase [Eubacteriales bacterium]|nr:aminopeptidase [Eubacteriales bacterium]